MKVGYLGAGTWGFALASLLSSNGHQVLVWARERELAESLEKNRLHPKLSAVEVHPNVHFTHRLEEVVMGAEVLVESVTSQGIRPVFKEVAQLGRVDVPIILTSKGIEQGSCFLLPEVVASLLGVERHPLIGALSGPSHAEEVIHQMPTSVVGSSYSEGVMRLIIELFTTPMFRVYPNSDLPGVCFGGAMKNIIAIACGISDGLTGSDNAKAALMTRGLHEMRKLCKVKEGKPETLNGLSGMGDLCVTCMSRHSRNYRFGKLLSEGLSPEGARQKIGMAVEGIHTCVAARELGRKYHVPVPITEATYAIIYEGLDPREAVRSLLTRAIKEEHL